LLDTTKCAKKENRYALLDDAKTAQFAARRVQQVAGKGAQRMGNRENRNERTTK